MISDNRNGNDASDVVVDLPGGMGSSITVYTLNLLKLSSVIWVKSMFVSTVTYLMLATRRFAEAVGVAASPAVLRMDTQR